MSELLQVVVGATAIIAFCGLVWRTILLPVKRLIISTDQLLPVLVDLKKELGGTPNAFAILDEIVGQLRTDSGSSLRDTINRIDLAAKVSAQAAEELKVGVKVVKELAAEDRRLARGDRQAIADLIALARAGGATGLRIEAAADHVAEELADAQQRADNVPMHEPPGAASDAASRPAQE